MYALAVTVIGVGDRGDTLMTAEKLYDMLRTFRIQKKNCIVILTKETFMQLTGQTIKDVTDIMFGEWHVYLGKQDKIQVIESEVWL